MRWMGENMVLQITELSNFKWYEFSRIDVTL